MGGRSNVMCGRTRATLRKGFEGGFVGISPTEVTLNIFVERDEENSTITIASGDHAAFISVISGYWSKSLALKILQDKKRVDCSFVTEGGIVEIWISEGQLRLITRIGNKKGEDVKFSTLKPDKEREQLIALCLTMHTERQNP